MKRNPKQPKLAWLAKLALFDCSRFLFIKNEPIIEISLVRGKKWSEIFFFSETHSLLLAFKEHIDTSHNHRGFFFTLPTFHPGALISCWFKQRKRHHWTQKMQNGRYQRRLTNLCVWKWQFSVISIATVTCWRKRTGQKYYGD